MLEKKRIIKFIYKNKYRTNSNWFYRRKRYSKFLLNICKYKSKRIKWTLWKKTNFCPPTWFKDLEQDKEKIILVINKIDTIPQEEQLKFIEILKYKQVSTFKLKDNIRIILTAKDKSKVDNEIKSLSAIV